MKRAIALATTMLMTTACAGPVQRATSARDTTSALDQALQLQRTCQYDAARQVLEKELPSSQPADRSRLLVALGSVAQHRGERANALKYYEEAVAGETVSLDALLFLGMAQVQDRQYEAGNRNLQAFMHGTLRAGNTPEWWAITASALALAELNRFEDAERLLDGALQALEFTDPLVTELRDLVRQTRAAGGKASGQFWQLAYGGSEFAAAADADYSAVPVARVAPKYPSAAAAKRLEGRVVLDLQIDERGSVTAAKIRESHPPGTFDQAALRVVTQWKFRPGMRQCKPAPTRGTQTIFFTMDR